MTAPVVSVVPLRGGTLAARSATVLMAATRYGATKPDGKQYCHKWPTAP
ncbi:MAG: hypothetical protein ABWY06_17625 [Pseudomonas sp.]